MFFFFLSFLVNIIGLESVGICMCCLQRGSEAQRTLLVVEGTPLSEKADKH